MSHMFESGAGPDKAWHGLMTVVEGLQTADAMIVAAGLDWEVEKLPMYAHIGSTVIDVPDKFAQVRTKDHKVLGVVGNIYTDVSNSKAFTWADELVGGFGAHYKTAGSLYGGRVVWVLLEVPFAIKSPDGELRTMLYLRNSHDGTSKLTLGFTTVDIVCANTLAMAEASALDRVEIKHTTNAELRLKDAQQTMHLVEGAAQRAGELAEKLFASKVNNNDLTTVLNKVFPLPVFNATAERRNLTTGELRSLSIAENKRAAVVAAYNHRPALYGTKWGVYEAFSAAYQHQDIDSKDAAANERKADTIFTNIMAAKSPADEALAVLVAS